MSKTPNERLRDLRIKAGYDTAADFARAHGINEYTYRAHEGGGRAIKPDTAQRYARILGVKWTWLLSGEGDEPEAATVKAAAAASSTQAAAPMIHREFVPVGFQTVMVRGEVEAGVWREAYEWPGDEWQPITVPTGGPYDPKDLFALRVRGSSMDKRYPEGSMVVCVPLWRVGRQPRNGEDVVVERHDATGKVEATVKELEIKPDGKLLLWPRSSHPRYQTPFELPADGLPWGLQDGPATYVHDGLAEQVSEIRVIALVVGGFKWNM